MQKLLMSCLMVVVTMCVGSLPTVKASQARGGDRTTSKSPVLLLPGYRYRESSSIDSQPGRIWKQNGPVIDYEIGRVIANEALAYAERFPKMSLLRLAPSQPEQVVLTMDLEHDRIFVSVGYTANFTATNLRSRQDVVEVMAMIYTYRNPLVGIDRVH